MTRPINDPDGRPPAGAGRRQAPAYDPIPGGWEGHDLYILLAYGPAPDCDAPPGLALLGPFQDTALAAMHKLAAALRHFAARHRHGPARFAAWTSRDRPLQYSWSSSGAEIGRGWRGAGAEYLVFGRDAGLEVVGPLLPDDLGLLESALEFALKTEEFGLLLDARVLGPTPEEFDVDVIYPEDEGVLESWRRLLRPGDYDEDDEDDEDDGGPSAWDTLEEDIDRP